MTSLCELQICNFRTAILIKLLPCYTRHSSSQVNLLRYRRENSSAWNGGVGRVTAIRDCQNIWNNILTLYRRTAYIVAAQSILLNSRMATIVVANSVSKFGEILFTPIRLITVVCYAAGPLKVGLSYRRQTVPPPPPKPHHIRRYIGLRLVNAHLSTMT